ncbi:hypothetical protein [Kitasatospora aureofaciens]|uniref:hypothetical protein n=1 Tax=Kitasatospora aureofaciens TaxID=1894 RepID=UPI0033EFE9A9
MPLLPPTVVGPLSECSTSVRVQNQLVGSTVTLLVNGSHTVGGQLVGGGVATWPDQEFPLTPGVALHAGDQVAATQLLGGQVSAASAQPVAVQKEPAVIGSLHYGGHQYVCGQCLWIDGAVPGATVTVKQGATVLGSATAPDGIARVQLGAPIAAGEVLMAEQQACGNPGTPTPSPVPDGPPEQPPPPVVHGPLLACQTGVPVSGVFEGAQVTLHRTGVPNTTRGCFDLSALTFRVPPLVEGEQVSADQAFVNCEALGGASATVVVGPADQIPAPAVVAALCAGGTSVRVTGLVVGALVTVLENGVVLGTAQAFEPSADLDVPALIGGGTVTARQELCGYTSPDSAPVVVDPQPAGLPAPVVVPPLFECASRVRVINVQPGALVLVHSAALGAPIGLQYVYAGQADIPVAPLLSAGDQIYAVQLACGRTSPRSALVTVQQLGAVEPPTVRTPLTECTRWVWVDGVVPGADVDVYVNGRWQGTATTTTPSVQVGVSGPLRMNDTVSARQRIRTTVTEFGPAATVAFGPVSVTTQHNDNRRTGANLLEVTLRPSNVGPKTFGKVFTRAVDGEIYGQPLYLCQVDVAGVGQRNVVYVATMHNSVYAFDADDPNASAPLWHARLGPSAPMPDPNIGPGGYADISVEVGVISTPVISVDRNLIYVVAFTKEGNTYHHTLHALDLRSGQESLGGPVRIAATVPGSGEGSVNGTITFTSHLQIQRAALTLVNDRLYVAFAAYGDREPYHGWVFGFDADNLQQTGVFITTPDTGLGGIWQAGQGLAADGNGDLYFMTGNGGFRPDGSNLSCCIVKLSPDLKLLDWFAPFNQAFLNGNADLDLGSAGPLLIPNTNLLLGGGKEAKFYLLDTGAMGHFQAGSDSQIVQSFWLTQDHTNNHIHGGPVYWDFQDGPLVYVWPENVPLRAYRFAGGVLQTAPAFTSTTPEPPPFIMPGGFLSVSANGSDPDSGLLWASHVLKDDANHAVVEGVFRVYLASDLTKELWNSKMNAARDDVGLFAKFVPPTVANGKVYLATFSGALNVYGLLE